MRQTRLSFGVLTSSSRDNLSASASVDGLLRYAFANANRAVREVGSKLTACSARIRARSSAPGVWKNSYSPLVTCAYTAHASPSAGSSSTAFLQSSSASAQSARVASSHFSHRSVALAESCRASLARTGGATRGRASFCGAFVAGAGATTAGAATTGVGLARAGEKRTQATPAVTTSRAPRNHTRRRSAARAFAPARPRPDELPAAVLRRAANGAFVAPLAVPSSKA